MPYPANCLRGISDKAAIVEGEYVAPFAFPFHDADKRPDGWIEQSINWEDDENAIPFTLAQKREDGIIKQFPCGLAVVPRQELDRLRAHLPVAGRFSYERQSIEGNKYHGNLLLKFSTPKIIKNMISSGIALASRFVPPLIEP